MGEVEVLLIGGRSRVGKTAVGYEVSEVLAAAEVAHVLIDGDNLNACYPKPSGDPHGMALTEANLGALWANYAAAGQHRVVYVNTVAVLEAPMVVRAVGGDAQVVAVLLTAGDDVVAQRLAVREIGSTLERHVQRSATMAVHLHDRAEPSVARVPTGGAPSSRSLPTSSRPPAGRADPALPPSTPPHGAPSGGTTRKTPRHNAAAPFAFVPAGASCWPVARGRFVQTIPSNGRTQGMGLSVVRETLHTAGQPQAVEVRDEQAARYGVQAVRREPQLGSAGACSGAGDPQHHARRGER